MTRTFLHGLAAVLPLGLTVYLLYWVVASVEDMLQGIYTWVLPTGEYRYGIGLALAIVVVFVAGMLLNVFLVQRVYDAAVSQVTRIPLVKSLYGMLQDMMGYFTMPQRRGNDQVVLVTLGNARLIGLVTRRSFAGLPGFDQGDTVGVYLPMSYQLGGFLVMVPRTAIEPVPLTVEQAMRFAVTAGVSTGSKGVGATGNLSAEGKYSSVSAVLNSACAPEPSSSCSSLASPAAVPSR
jgi:uncharacterized membrane protein